MRFLAGVALIAFPAAACFGTPVRYTISSVLDPGANYVAPESIAANGDIAGYSWGVVSVSFIDNDNQYRTLSTGQGQHYDQITQINGVGKGIGFDAETGEPLTFNGKSFSPLAKPSGASSTDYFPDGLNNEGDMVGVINGYKSVGGLPDFLGTPVVWHQNVPQVLPTLAGQGFNEASAINDQGVIVGISADAKGTEQAVVWQDGHIKTLPTLGGGSGTAMAINNHNVIAGVSGTSGNSSHLAEWSNGHVTDLGPEEYVGGINDSDQIVGDYQNQAMLWENGQRINLNTVLPADSGWQLTGAQAINDKGQIIGIGLYQEHERGFLLTPIAGSSPGSNAIPLPDPAAAGLMLTPLAIFAMRRSLRKQAAV